MKNKFFLILSAVLICGVLILLNYKNDKITILPSYQTSSMKALHLTHKEGDRVKWELKAEDAKFPEGDKRIILKSLELKIYYNPEVYLSGGSGIYKINKETLTVEKPIELRIKDMKFTTDTLTWHGKKGLITTDDNVRFKGKKFIVEGKGLVANIEKQTVEVLKDVKGIFYR